MNNNMLAKAAIWRVIALVLFTVFKQFEGRKPATEAMEDRAFTRLQVALVTGRQRQQLFDLGARRSDARMGGAHQFDDVGIALVRHDRAAGGVLRRQR
ncbi:MAG: hypothetical protein RR758_05395, partial [Burkholderiaceae bacterium]